MQRIMAFKSSYTPTQALEKGRKYCAYQERSHSEVRSKLYSWGMYSKDVERLITQLIEEGYINEERFARAFARGKFRIKQWGRIKITQALKLKDISRYTIEAALSEIDEDEYKKTLQKLIKKKTASLKDIPAFQRNYKVMQYCLSRGFEKQLILLILKGEAD